MKYVKKEKKQSDILKFDGICLNFKNIALWTAVDRKTKELVGFEVGTRETKYFEILSKNIAHIKAEKYASDNWEAYNLIDPNKRLIGKAHIYNVERMNRLLRYYLS